MAGCGGQSSEKLSSRGVGQCVLGTGLPLRDGRVLSSYGGARPSPMSVDGARADLVGRSGSA